MPDYGRLTLDQLPHTLPAVSPLYPPPSWPLPGARILKLVFETDKEAVLRWLPPALSRSSPPYAIITVAHYPQSPVGPFSLATQYIGCRARFFVRGFALQAIVDSDRAMAALREVWGIPCKLGRVSLTAGPRTVAARVACGPNVLARLRMTRGERADAGLTRFDPIISVRLPPAIEEGKRHALVEMVQIDPEYEVHEAYRGKGEVTYPSASEGEPWHLLPSLNVISATYAVADTQFPLARFVMPY